MQLKGEDDVKYIGRKSSTDIILSKDALISFVCDASIFCVSLSLIVSSSFSICCLSDEKVFS